MTRRAIIASLLLLEASVLSDTIFGSYPGGQVNKPPRRAIRLKRHVRTTTLARVDEQGATAVTAGRATGKVMVPSAPWCHHRRDVTGITMDRPTPGGHQFRGQAVTRASSALTVPQESDTGITMPASHRPQRSLPAAVSGRWHGHLPARSACLAFRSTGDCLAPFYALTG